MEIEGYEVPDELYYTTDHLWAKVEDNGKVRVGLDAFGATAVGTIEYIDLPQEDDEFDAGEAFGSMESAKWVGGGIGSLKDARNAFNAGADKVSINTAAFKNPDLINDIAKYFGTQACVIAIDAKRRYGREASREVVDTAQGECWFECSFYGGREFTGIDAIQWAVEAEERGAGDIMLTSMDQDGTKDGFDIELTSAISDSVNIPVIASGGCGNLEHILEVFKKTNASAALAASIFHFGEYTVLEVKDYLKKNGVHVRS